MPQLPSGQQVSVSADRALSLARDGNLAACTGFGMRVDVLGDIAPLIDIIPYEVVSAVPAEDEEEGPIVQSDMTLAELDTEKCSWWAEDKRFFLAWLEQPRARAWMQSMFEELKDLFEAEAEADDLPDYLKQSDPTDVALPAGKADSRRGKGRRGR